MLQFSVKSHNELFIASNIKQLGDAQFIAQACNNFEGLLETCKWVQQEIRTMWDEADLPECNQRLEAAITKAEAKS